MQKKLYVFKLDQDNFHLIVDMILANKFFENFFFPREDGEIIDVPRLLTFYHNKSKLNKVFARLLNVIIYDSLDNELELSCVNGFGFDKKTWQQEDFVSKYLGEILKKNSIKTNYSYAEYDENTICYLIGEYFKNEHRFKLLKSKRNLIKVKCFGALDNDFRCIVCLSNSFKVGEIDVAEIDKKIDFSKGDYNNVEPYILKDMKIK